MRGAGLLRGRRLRDCSFGAACGYRGRLGLRTPVVDWSGSCQAKVAAVAEVAKRRARVLLCWPHSWVVGVGPCQLHSALHGACGLASRADPLAWRAQGRSRRPGAPA